MDIGPEDAVEQRLNKIDGLLAQYGFDLPLFAPLIAKLLAVPFAERYPPLDLPADRQRQLTIDVLVELAIERSRRQPVLVVFEDLHWIDPSSLDLLTQLIERGSDVRQLAVLSFRPEFTPPWAESNRLVRIDLGRLDRAAAAGIVIETAATTMSTELLGQVVGKADGVPLYLEELTKLVVEEGLIQAAWRHPDGPHPEAVDPGVARRFADRAPRPPHRRQASGTAQRGHRTNISRSSCWLESLKRWTPSTSASWRPT